MEAIVVAGGAGFLGSHLCERFMADGYYVICFDDLSTGKWHNVWKYPNDRFQFHHWDITRDISLDMLGVWGNHGTNAMSIKLPKFKAVVNMACPASPKHYQADPIKTMVTNVNGTLNLLRLAKVLDADFIQASTSEVYGDPLQHPQDETYLGNVNPTGIRACYDEGKRAAEALCYDHHRMFGMNVRVARIFNTYGPKMCPYDGRVVSNFITAALADANLDIYGDGNQTRSFGFVDDTVDALVRLTYSDYVGQPINIGNPVEFTVKELAQKVVQKVGKGYIQYMPAVSDDPKQRKPVITKAKEILDWEPKVSLDEGLDKTIEYFRSLR